MSANLPCGLDAAAEIAVDEAVRRRRVVPHAGELDAIGAARQAMAPIAHEQRSRLLGEHRREGEIVMIREREVVGHLHRGAELIGMGVGRHQEAGLALHGRVGALEVGHPDDRHAEEVEERVLEGDRRLVPLCVILLARMRQVGGLLGIFLARFARREPAVLEHGDVAGLARSGCATMRVSSLVTSFNASMKPSRKSSVSVIWSEVMIAPSGSLMRTLPSAASVLGRGRRSPARRAACSCRSRSRHCPWP